MRLLVTGGAGYLGSEVCRQALDRGWDVLATQLRVAPPHGRAVRLDVRDEEETARVFLRHGPEVVIHTAYRMDDAPTIVRGGHAVALNAHRVGARLVHVSTDLVFDGEQGAPYTEDDEPRPVMAYGAAKLEAERLVARVDPQALIVRTSLLYGPPDGPQEALARREGVEFFTDEIRSPLHVADLAGALLELSDRDVGGILHVAGPEPVSRYELAALLKGGPVKGRPSPRDGRPRDVSLDSSRAYELLGTSIRSLAQERIDTN